MDITTLIGIVVGTFLVINGIGTDKLGNFVDKSSILIVVGGTLAATVASYPLSILMDIPKHIMVLFRGKQYNIPKLVEQLVDLAMIARQSGLLALEEKADEIKDPFFRQSVLMIVDANDPDKVRFVLERELENMIGTLVGLINMLKGLNLDDGGGATNLGQDMSVALITTFYGSVLSNLIFHPIAKKLRIRQDEEELYCSTIIEGIIAIQSGENPKYLREHLLASIKQSQQRKLLSKAEAVSAKGGGVDSEE